MGRESGLERYILSEKISHVEEDLSCDICIEGSGS